MGEDRREEFRHLLDSYVRLYGFLSQIVPFADADLEKLYAFARLLRTKLPKREAGTALDLDDDVALTYYRLDKTFEGSLALGAGNTGALTGATDVGTGGVADETKSPLSAVIKLVNERFGTEFTEEDQLFFDQVVGDLAKDEALSEQARSNSLDNFRHVFEPKATSAVVDWMERNGEMSEHFMSNDEFRAMFVDAMAREFRDQARGKGRVPARAKSRLRGAGCEGPAGT